MELIPYLFLRSFFHYLRTIEHSSRMLLRNNFANFSLRHLCHPLTLPHISSLNPVPKLDSLEKLLTLCSLRSHCHAISRILPEINIQNFNHANHLNTVPYYVFVTHYISMFSIFPYLRSHMLEKQRLSLNTTPRIERKSFSDLNFSGSFCSINAPLEIIRGKDYFL